MLNARAWIKGVSTALAASALTLMVSVASAAPAGLIGPIPDSPYSPPFGAAHRADVTADLNAYFGVTDITFLGRFDGDDGSFDAAAVLDGTGADGVITGVPGKSGTWTFIPGTSDYIVVAIEINGGSVGQLYEVSPPSNTGFWDMDDILNPGGNHPDLSHLDLYGLLEGGPGFCELHPELCEPTGVPEPATLALFGAALAGAGIWRRRRRTA